MSKTLEDTLNKTTLVDELRAVEKILDSAQIDKLAAYRNVLQHWSRIPLVYKMFTGVTAPIEEFKEVYRSALMAFVPHFIGDEKRKNVKELEQVVGDLSLVYNNKINLIMNPIGLGLIGGVFYLGVHLVLNYHGLGDLVSTDKGAFALGAFLGSFVGLNSSIMKSLLLYNARMNAYYVQVKIQEVRRL